MRKIDCFYNDYYYFRNICKMYYTYSTYTYSIYTSALFVSVANGIVYCFLINISGTPLPSLTIKTSSSRYAM